MDLSNYLSRLYLRKTYSQELFMSEQHKPCPNCGNELEFSAEHQALFCRHCESIAEIENNGGAAVATTGYLETLAGLDNGEDAPEQIIAVCKNCAAELELPRNVVADRCSYCSSPIFAAEQSRRQLRPCAVIPFKINFEAALEHYRIWLRSRWFLPGKVKRQARTGKFNGVYLPHWTYDCGTKTDYTGQRGEYYFVTVSYTAVENGKSVRRTRQERRTRWYPAAGTVENRFRNVLVPANHSLPENLVKKLEPWSLGSLIGYQPDLIRGYQEQSYSVSLESGFGEAKVIMEPQIRETIRRAIGGDVQRIDGVAVAYHNIGFKLVLLPVWVNAFKFRNKEYIFLVNARTGEVQGERPWSVWKIIFFSIFILALVAGVIFFLNR